ncbi:putative Aminomethyltransferase [Rhodospirillaceae bacterium LM-1]|nr:putative Aminomethyltransferase [Rhodospirillaceae bacterium LM-1]
MSGLTAVHLKQRSFLELAGEDRRAFLQGLVSCDVMRLTPSQTLFGAMLTAQGKFMFDFFLIERGDAFLLEIEAERADSMLKKLSMYKLRSKVSLRLAPEWTALAAFGGDALNVLGLGGQSAGQAVSFADGVAYVDPRLLEAGARLALPADGGLAALEAAGFLAAPFDAWNQHRMALALPDGAGDLTPEKDLLLEAGYDELGGVDWKKGCYLGQELTARTKYRGLIKKRLLPVRYEGEAPAPGSLIMQGEVEAGEMRSGLAGLGVAKIRLEALGRRELMTVAGKVLTPEICAWMKLPEADSAG